MRLQEKFEIDTVGPTYMAVKIESESANMTTMLTVAFVVAFPRPVLVSLHSELYLTSRIIHIGHE